MTGKKRPEWFTSDNAELLASDVWDDDAPACSACGAPLHGAELRCQECGAVVPVCVGACGACVSPVCVSKS